MLLNDIKEFFQNDCLPQLTLSHILPAHHRSAQNYTNSRLHFTICRHNNECLQLLLIVLSLDHNSFGEFSVRLVDYCAGNVDKINKVFSELHDRVRVLPTDDRKYTIVIKEAKVASAYKSNAGIRIDSKIAVTCSCPERGMTHTFTLYPDLALPGRRNCVP
jgi:hypothetical protein